MKVCVLGSSGFVGKNLLRDTDWVGVSHRELDLMNQTAVEEYFKTHEYDVVVHCAASIDQMNESTTYKNISMFENVVRVFRGKLLYFSSGAALRGNPPVDPYGLSKWIIDQRIQTIPNAHSLRIWGCYGQDELSTRFSAVCREKGHVIITKDKYFDFIDIKCVCDIVKDYVNGIRHEKELNLVDPDTKLLSEWATFFGATYEIENTSELDEAYVLKIPNKCIVR